VFIGYSFPSTDFYAEWLFRQINFLQHSDGAIPVMDIDIVNPEILVENSTTYSRYFTIFKGHRIKKYKDLREYSKNNA